MEIMIMKFIVLIFISIEFFYFIKCKNKRLLIMDIKFWIIFPWSFCLFLYFFSGIEYKYNLNFKSFGFILIFWITFFCGYSISKNKKEVVDNQNKDFNIKLNLFPIFAISLISSVIYIIYILKTNTIILGNTRNIDTNSFTTILLFISNSSLIIWLYELAYAIINDKKMPLFAYISAFIYNIPVVLISGRDSLLIFIVSTLILIFYCNSYAKQIFNKKGMFIKKFKRKALLILLIMLFYVIFLTNNRYGTSTESAIEMFKWSSDCSFPNYLEDLYYKGGGLGKLVINFIYYYSSQFSKFALVYEKYNGPYLLGFYELHYVSRLLPDFFQLNYEQVNDSLKNISYAAGVPGIRVLWNTLIGHMIYDFGRIGSLIVSFIFGSVLRKIIDWTKRNIDLFKIVFNVMICVGMLLSIELSPLFDYYYIFPFIWFIILKIFYDRFRVIR